MQTKSIALMVLCCALAWRFASSPCFGAEEESKQVFDSLFAAKIKAVSATSSRADDVALANEMLAVAKTSTEQTGLLAMLCDAAYDLGFRTAEGYQVAIEAQQLLAESGKDKREGAQEKLITLLTRQSTTGKADEREAAGESLIALLLSMGDEKFEKKQYLEAAGDYRRAVSVATQRKSPSLEEAKAKLTFATARDRAVKNLARLEEKLLKDSNDFATAEEIVKIYVVEFDDPTSALPFLNRVKDSALKENVALAAAPVATLDRTSSRRLGDWYRSLAERTERTLKLAMLVRARSLYTRCLEVETEDGIKRATTVLLSNAVSEDIKKLEGEAASVVETGNPRMTYLGSLVASNVKTIRNVPYGSQGQFEVNGARHEIIVNRQRSLNGIALHPPPKGQSNATFKVGESFEHFEGGVAVNDTSPGSATPLTFSVIGDGRELWRSKPVNKAGEVEPFRISVKDIKEIQLVVECPGKNEWAFAVWIEPRLTRR